MTIIYVLVLFSLIFFNITFTNNEDYISKENTSIIKGICILWIILSHSTSYVGYNMFLDRIFYKINSYTGQLIVVMFQFYSGYGVVYSFYHKRNYLDSFIKNRIINTLFNFDIAIILFLIISIIYEGFPSISKIILSFIGWDSFGNSNWYIFDILILYYISYIVLKLKNYKFSIVLSWIFCIMFVLTMYRLKPSWWYNTILAYPLGMTFYYCKEKVEKILKNKFFYFTVLLLLLVWFSIIHILLYLHPLMYVIYSILFAIITLLLSMKIKISSKILKWFGDNLFYIYIIQRLPMIVLSKYINNSYLFLVVSFIITILLVYPFKSVCAYLWNKSFRS